MPDCVECKAQLVDIQETYVHAARAIRSHAQVPPAQPAQLQRLRQRLAVEAELLAAHLSTEDLLLSVENGTSIDGRAHLSACSGCQDRAADLHLQLAEIEVELHRQVAFEFPDERRAAALAALRVRLEREVETRTAKTTEPRWRLPSFSLPRIPAFASYATAFAAVCLAVWTGLNVRFTEVPAPESLARLATPATPELALILRNEPAATSDATGTARLPQRFEWEPSAASAVPAAPTGLADAGAPELALAGHWGDPVAFDLPSLSDLPGPPSSQQALAANAVPVPARSALSVQESAESVVEGRWMLVRTGFWKHGFDADDSGGGIRFTGSVPSERDRIAAEDALLAVANGWPVDFEIAVRTPRADLPAGVAPAAVGRVRQAGGLVRNSLVQHYEDAARRSFRQPDRSLLESELDRYVSDVLRHDAELLSHVHALHSLLNRPGIDEARHSDSFRKVVRFHLDAISNHEAGIYDRLSEALPRRYWAYRSQNDVPADVESFGAASLDLLRDALALDRALNSLLFPSSEALDARESNLSSASLLARVRQQARRLKAAVKQ